MNEPLFAFRLRRALDESAERLPPPIVERLARSRELALAAMPQPGAGAGERTAASRASGPWLRLAAGAVPVLVVLAGLYGIATWHAVQEARQTAEIDAALLTDVLPIDAYADLGFGVFIRNTRQ
jgi:hypothetical protein